MYLEKIDSPQKLKTLSVKELKVLAGEIRKRIIEVCSERGGHLASSLGTVEICLALHYVLDTPKDKIVFDVGHQAYAHKIITHRAKDFSKLRQLGGLSGFPSHKESVYDVFSVGHASNAVSLALGISEANRIFKERVRVVAVIGDGSLSGGECFEGLNNAGHLRSDILVIFNHNEMSISPSVGALSNYLNKIISLPVYNRLKLAIDSSLRKVPKLGKRIFKWIRKLEEVTKGLIVPGIFFEELGFRYFGPLDGHNLDLLIPTLKNIVDLEGPKLLHLVTVKGKGYSPSEKNPEEFHSASKFFLGEPKCVSSGKLFYTQVFSSKLSQLASKDKKIVALTAAMTKGTGLSEFKERFPERFFDVGIAEQHLVSFAAGLSKRGLKPVVAVYSTFLQRAYDQLVEDIALQELSVVFAVDRAGLVGEDGPTHHGIFDIAFLRSVPGLVVISPAYEKDLEEALEFSLNIDKPCVLRYPKDEVLQIEMREKIALGKFEVIQEGKDVAILCVGSMLKEVLSAQQRLKELGVSPLIVNIRFIKPLDKEFLEYLGKNFQLAIIVEEGVAEGGIGEGILDFLREKGLLSRIKIKRLALPPEFITFGKRSQLLRNYGLDSEGIFSFIKKNCLLLNKNTKSKCERI